MASACRFVLSCSLIAAAQGQRLYDCDAELYDWKNLWTPEWKAWCCANEQKGCPSTSTATVTSTTKTTTTMTQTSTTTLEPTTTTGFPCRASCQVDDTVATCQERIQWAAAHETAHEESPCDSALTLVAKQCSDACVQCVQTASARMWCDANADTSADGGELHFLQRFETQRVSTGADARIHTASAVMVFSLLAFVVGGMVAGRFGQAWRSRADAEQEEQLIDEVVVE